MENDDKILDKNVSIFLSEYVEKKIITDKQHRLVKEKVICLLENIVSKIKNEEYKDIGGFTFSSPAGDFMGMDNNCIDFSKTVYSSEVIDITQAMDILVDLKEGEFLHELVKQVKQ